MANEISVASMLSDGVLSAFIVSEYMARNARPDDIRGVLERSEILDGSGSNSQRVALYDDDFTFNATTSEIVGGVGNADPDWGHFSLTPARRLLPFQRTDLASATAQGMDPSMFVTLMVNATGKTVTEMACAAAAAATQEVGDGTGPMTLDLLMQAKGQLEDTNTPSPHNCVMTSKAYTELVESLRGETGTLSWQPATAAVVEAKGPFYKGEVAGIGIWVTNRVDTSDAGAVAQNFMFGKNGISYGERNTAALMADAVESGARVIDLGTMYVEWKRDADNGMTTLIGNYYPAVSLVEDLAVVRVQTATGA